MLVVAPPPAAEFLAANDKVVLYVGKALLGGDINDPLNVEAFKSEMGQYLQKYRRAGQGGRLRRGASSRTLLSSGRGGDPRMSSNQSFVRRLIGTQQHRTATSSFLGGSGRSDHSLRSEQPRDSVTSSAGPAAKPGLPANAAEDAKLLASSAAAEARATSTVGALAPHKSLPAFDDVADATIAEDSSEDDDDDDDDDNDADPVRLGQTEGVRKSILRQKFRMAVRRLVFMHKFEQVPAATDGSIYAPRNSAEQLRKSSKSSTNWRQSIAAGLFARADKSMDALIKEQSNIYQYNDLRRGALDDRLPWNVIHPDSTFRLTWDVVMLSLVVFFGFMVPYRLGFDIELSPAETIIDMVADVLFLIDIALNFRTAFKDDGVVVSDGKAMASNYASSWLFIDFVASFPIGWFTDTGGVNKVFRMLRLFKLFRMLRLLRLFPRFTQVLEASIKFNPSMIRFLRSFAVMFLIWHNIGCTYWFVAREELNGVGSCPEIYGNRRCYVNHCVCDPDDPTGSIVILPTTDPSWHEPANPNNWVPHYSLADAGIGNQYAQAVFWAVEVTTGIGDDISPKSQVEVFFTAFMVIVGLMMYSLIIGSASSALANIDSTATQRRQTLEKVNAFMRSRKVPSFFQRIIVDFYEHMWQTPQREADVFRDLPASLRSRLAIVMNRDLIDRIPIFKLMCASVYVRIVQRLQHNTYLPGEYVIQQGSESDFLFFVKRGKVDALLPNTEHTIYMTLFPGDVFGEAGLIFDERRNESCRAVDFLDVLMMNQLEYQELVVTAPTFVMELRRIAAAREYRRLSFELTLLRRAAKAKTGMPGSKGRAMICTPGIKPPGGPIHKVDAAASEWAKGAASRVKVAPSDDASDAAGSVGVSAQSDSLPPPRLATSSAQQAATRHSLAPSMVPMTSMSPTNLDGSKRSLNPAAEGSANGIPGAFLPTGIEGSARMLPQRSVASSSTRKGALRRSSAPPESHIQAWNPEATSGMVSSSAAASRDESLGGIPSGLGRSRSSARRI